MDYAPPAERALLREFLDGVGPPPDEGPPR
jgi:hypothetical protein